MPANSPTPTPPRRPQRLLRCDACGKSIECTVAEVIRYVQADWPMCCGYAMRYFVEAELPTPLGMRRPPPKLPPKKKDGT